MTKSHKKSIGLIVLQSLSDFNKISKKSYQVLIFNLETNPLAIMAISNMKIPIIYKRNIFKNKKLWIQLRNLHSKQN